MARILVVDDEADMRLALSNVLTRTGHQVLEAPEGETALGQVARERPDLVLLDMRLPGMDGIQILKRIREGDRDLPVIMVTGYGSVDSAIEVMRLGASHYLAKPFSNKELIETVERVLEARRVPVPAGGSGRGPSRQGDAPIGGLPALPGPASPASSRDLLWAGLALAALALLAWPVRKGLEERGREFEVAYSHPSAIVWAGDRLWTADWFSQSVHEQVLQGGRLKSLRSTMLPNTHITGMAVGKDVLYVSDGWKRTLQRRRLDGALALLGSVKSPGPSPSGLFWDGRYLWSSDSGTGRIYQHEPDDSLTVVAEYRGYGKALAGIYKDERFFWSADADLRTIYQHRLDKQLRVIATYRLPALDEGGQPLSSFALHGDAVWFARDGLARLYERGLRGFHMRPAAP